MYDKIDSPAEAIGVHPLSFNDSSNEDDDDDEEEDDPAVPGWKCTVV